MAWMPQVRDRSGKATVEKGKKYMSCSSIQAGPTNISLWNTALYTFKSVPLSTSEFSVEMLHFLKQLNCLIPRNCSMTRWCYSLSPYAQKTELTFEFVHAWALIKTFVKLMHLNRFYPVSSKEPVLVVHMKCHTGQKPLLSSRIDTDMHFSAQHFLKLKNPSTLLLFHFCSTVYSDNRMMPCWPNYLWYEIKLQYLHHSWPIWLQKTNINQHNEMKNVTNLSDCISADYSLQVLTDLFLK